MTSWQTKKLGVLAKVQTGPFGAQLHEKDYVKTDGTPIITVENLIDGVVKLLPTTPRVSDDDKRRLSKYVLSKGDIVFSRVGAVDRSAYVTDEANGWMFSGRLLRVHPGKDLDAKYLNYHLTDEHTKNLIRNLAVGGTMPSLNTEILNFVPIKYPEKPEQERIVGVLEVWDEYIEKLEQKIALKEQLKKGLMQQLLTGKLRLPGFNDDWHDLKIGEFAKESRVKDAENNPHKRLTVRLHLKGVTARIVRGTESLDSTQYFARSAGQLIYGKQNIFKGAIGIVPEKFEGYSSSQDIPSFDIDSKKAEVQFLFYLLSREPFYKWLENFAGGSGSKRLHTSEFYNVKVKIPVIEEQSAISSVLDLATKDIDKLKRKKSTIEKQKKYLLKNLITGAIRTPETLTQKGVSS